jgi:PAS domain S-box-containing protein
MEEKKERHRNQEILLRSLQVMYFSIDMEANQLLQISPTCEQMFGYTVQELHQNPHLWMGVVLEEDRPKVDRYYPAMLVGRRIHQSHRITDKNGTIKWIEVRLAPTLDTRGKLIRVDGIATDITARKEVEAAWEYKIQELQSANKTLNEELCAASKELNDRYQELLVTAKKGQDKCRELEAENAYLKQQNEELDRFVYGASHELRAPLSSVQGLVDIIEGQEEDPRKRKLLDMMRTKVERLDLFIQDIVHYARNARQEVESEKIDFAQMISESIDQLRYMPDVDNIRITTELQVEDEFYTDRKRLSVILNNLISNAIKYSNPQAAHPFIHIYVRQTPESASLEVRDNGMGIHQAHLDKIFNMFFRATKAQTGSGLGLYIVKEIIEKLQGGLHVDSQEGEGSTFQFHIPNLKTAV